MRHLFKPWTNALLRFVLRTPPGPRTPPVPVPPPPGLEPPAHLPDAENGYGRLLELARRWPDEGMYPPDLGHWRKTLPQERAAATRALAPLRPALDQADGLLASEPWQAIVPEGGGFPELAKLRRFGQALLLRGDLEGRPEDRDRALELARRVRRCQGPFMHFLVGLALEKLAGGSFEGLEEDRAEATRWELARYIVPRAHRAGPWEPVDYDSPPEWTLARLCVRWALAGHPLPYEPTETVAGFVAEQSLMAAGSSTDLQARAESVGAPWPSSLYAARAFGPGAASLRDLRAARIALRDVPDPYGRLYLAQTLRTAGNLARAAEQARKKG